MTVEVRDDVARQEIAEHITSDTHVGPVFRLATAIAEGALEYEVQHGLLNADLDWVATINWAATIYEISRDDIKITLGFTGEASANAQLRVRLFV